MIPFHQPAYRQFVVVGSHGGGGTMTAALGDGTTTCLPVVVCGISAPGAPETGGGGTTGPTGCGSACWVLAGLPRADDLTGAATGAGRTSGTAGPPAAAG